MICSRPEAQLVNDLYMRIRSKRPAWFRASTGLDTEDYTGFANWIQRNVSFWFDNHDNIVLVERQDFVAMIHPLFLGPVDMTFLQRVLDEMQALGIHRVEVPLLSDKGLSIRKALRRLGFQQEGILKHKDRIKGSQPSSYIYLDVQLWAKLLEGDIHG